MKNFLSAGVMAAALLLASCADPKAVDISVPPNSASSSTVTTSSTVVTTSAPAQATDANAAAPAPAPEDSKWKMHVDDRTLICGPHDRDLGRCD